jgi:hypothetical protein
MHGDAVESVQVIPASAATQRLLPLVGPFKKGANSYFELVHYFTWSFDDKGGPIGEDGQPLGEWLPNVGKANWTPGANGVSEEGRGANARINPTRMHAGILGKNGLLIRPEDPRLGEFQHYVAKVPLQSGRYYHIYKWVRLKLIGGGRNVSLDHDRNREDTRRFLRQLYTVGMVPVMLREELDQHIARRRARLGHPRGLMNGGKITVDAYERLERQCEEEIARWESAFSRLHGLTDEEAEAVDLTPAPASAPLLSESALASEASLTIPKPARRRAKKETPDG